MKKILNEWKKFTKKINEQAPAMGLGDDGMDQMEAELEAELDVAAAQPGLDDALAGIQAASAEFMGTGSPAPAATLQGELEGVDVTAGKDPKILDQTFDALGKGATSPF